MQNGQYVYGGSNLPEMETKISSLYFSEEGKVSEEDRYDNIERQCGTQYVYDFANHQRIRQDEAYAARHIDAPNGFPAEPVFEHKGSSHLKMTVACSHLGLYAYRHGNAYT